MLHVSRKRSARWRRVSLAAVGALLLSGSGCHVSLPPPNNLLGTWGGVDKASRLLPATLSVTADGARLTYPCGDYTQIDQPLRSDTNGHIKATGTYHSHFSPATPPIAIDAVVSGNDLTLTLTLPNTTNPPAIYVLTYGHQAPVYQGACPG